MASEAGSGFSNALSAGELHIKNLDKNNWLEGERGGTIPEHLSRRKTAYSEMGVFSEECSLFQVFPHRLCPRYMSDVPPPECDHPSSLPGESHSARSLPHTYVLGVR